MCLVATERKACFPVLQVTFFSYYSISIVQRRFARMAVSDLPVPRTGLQDRPTLLYSWWCTIFAMLLILARLAARKIRIDKLFIEDYFMACTIIPLFIRMGLVQIVLNDGTNNVDPSSLTSLQLLQREYGSKIVLAARVFFALT